MSAAVDVDAARLAAGEEVAGHRIESEIGRGGMGVVYRVRHIALDRARALKVIAPGLSADPRFRERFQRESRLAASIEHPNVIPVHHAGEERGLLYLSMRLVDGSDLGRMVESEGPLPPARATRLIAEVAAALDAAHAHGLVHRDVKPANVLVERRDGQEYVFLTDFGISRIAAGSGTVTSSGELLGSVDYVAPEQIEGKPVNGRTDVYSLGCVLHFALTGQPPFPRDNDLAKLFAHANAPRPRPSAVAPELPRGFDEVVARAMARSPEDRYPSAGELATDLERVVGALSPSERETAAIARPVRPAAQTPTTHRLGLLTGRRRLVAVGLLAAIAVALAVVLIVGGGGSSGPAERPPRAVATIDVGRGPTALTVGAINVWAASRDDHALYSIDPATNRLDHSPVPVAGDTRSVAAGFGAVWAVNRDADAVVRVDPGRARISVPVGRAPSDIAVDRRWVWVTNEGGDTVSRIDPATNRVNETIPVGHGPRSLAAGPDVIWVANTAGGLLSRIDPQDATVVGKPIAVAHPSDVAIGSRYVWVVDAAGGTLTRIDPDAADSVDRRRIGGHPSAVAVGFRYVWVADGASDTVTELHATNLKPIGDPVPVGNEPADIAIVNGGVWTANFGDATVTRIRP